MELKKLFSTILLLTAIPCTLFAQPSVTGDTRFARGATMAFGRIKSISANGGSTITKRGFCIAENPNPTIDDSVSTKTISSNGTIYYIRTNNFAATADFIDTSVEESTTKIFKLADGDPMNIKTSELGKLIRSKSGHIIDSFIDHCKAHEEETVIVSYQDEHMKSILSMILTLQTAGYFIKEIGNPFSMEFKLERYDSDSGKWDSMTANLPSSFSKQITASEKKIGRDEWLENLSNSWLEDMDYDNQIEGTILPIASQPKNSLTHWRVLSFECAGKRLSIYPDGGLMNGWSIYNAPGQYHRYDTSTITHDTEIDLCRNQEIKFDVTIEEI